MSATTRIAGRYEVVRPLGHGAMATVDLAQDVELDRPIALKRLAENLALFDFTLSELEMAEIGRLARRGERIVDWTWSPKWD